MSEAMICKYEENEIIAKQGDTTKCLYKVISGKAALYLNYKTADEYLVGITSAPNCFGEMTILADRPLNYTVVPLTKMLVLRVPEENFEAFIQNNHQNAITIMKTMAKNILLLDANMKMMISELNEMLNEDNVDADAIRMLTDRCAEPEVGAVSSDEIGTLDEDVSATQPIEHNLYKLFPIGHKAYPKITHPEYSQFIYPKNYTCPHCQKEFESTKVFTSKLMPDRFANNQRKYDLKTAYKDFNMSWYDIVTCPHCGFSMLQNVDTSNKNYTEFRSSDRLESIFNDLSLDFSAERDMNFVFTQHYLAMLCCKSFSNHYQITAHLWQNLYELYKDTGDEEMTVYAFGKLIASYKDVYSFCMLTPRQEQNVCLSLASLLYYNGYYANAREWAQRVIMIKNGHQAYQDLARELLQDIRTRTSSN